MRLARGTGFQARKMAWQDTGGSDGRFQTQANLPGMQRLSSHAPSLCWTAFQLWSMNESARATHLSKLVNPLACVVCMHALVLCPKVPPLEAVDRPQIPDVPADTACACSGHADDIKLETNNCWTVLTYTAALMHNRSARGKDGWRWHSNVWLEACLSVRPMLSKYSLEPLPSHMWMSLSCRTWADVLPLMNHSNSSATPAA